jgi:hypothetical protein
VGAGIRIAIGGGIGIDRTLTSIRRLITASNIDTDCDPDSDPDVEGPCSKPGGTVKMPTLAAAVLLPFLVAPAPSATQSFDDIDK